MGTMFPCVGAGALPTLRGKVADGGAIMTQLALPGSGVAGQYRSLSKKLMNWLRLSAPDRAHSLEKNAHIFRNDAEQ
jgi:hypothetical protein